MSKEDRHNFLFFSNSISDETLVLSPEEVAHLTTVLKYGEGSQITVTDGAGTLYRCRLEKIKKGTALCSIVEKEFVEPIKPAIHIYAGLPDKERFERMCEALPPLNVATLTPVVHRGSKKSWWAEKWFKTAERFQRVVIASQKQSLNPYLTEIVEPTPFKEAVKNAKGQIFYGCFTGQPFPTLMGSLQEGEEISFFVGPPDGFTSEEEEELKLAGAKGVYLGCHRLRTELAAITFAALCTQLKNS